MYFLTTITIIVLTKLFSICGQINMTIYQTLPPLYEFDNYDQCLSQPLSTYCMVFAEIEPNANSEIWNTIEELSSDLYHHFRHDNLFFGVCLEQCNELLTQLTPLELQELSRNKTIENEITNYYKKVHKRKEDSENRLLYQNILDACLNYRFQHKYNLTILTSIEYCEKSENNIKIDSLEIIFYATIAILILLNIISTFWDYRLKCQQPSNLQNNDFYKNKLKDPGSLLLTSFSLCRNYYRIANQNPNESDLKFTYVFRVFTLFIVILGHCIMLLMAIQIQNPKFIEDYYYHTETILFHNGSAMIQIFFVLAGFLLKLKFDQHKFITPESSIKMGILVYIQGFLARYLRLLPSLLMVIIFNATVLIRFEDGPFWRHISEAEYTFCREYWWKNVLMINNYMIKDSCAQHTWYLAADMQLYELFLFTIIVTSKFKSLRKPLYVLIGILAFLVPGILTYFYKLDAIHFLKPENYRYLYFKDTETFYITYPQFYCNLGGYLIGFICAEIYIKYIKNPKPNMDKYLKYRGVIKIELTLLIFIVSITIGLLLSGNLVARGNIEKPSLWLALYASLYRNIWTILGGFIFLCMLLKMGWIVYELACLPVFQLLGKISFQTYLWHVTIIRILCGFYRQPIYLNEFYMICQIILGFILTNIIAFFMAIFVEYPIGEILHYVLQSRIPRVRKITDDDNDEVLKEMKPNIRSIC